MKTAYIYMINNVGDPYDDNCYIGSTWDLKKRMYKHESNCISKTKKNNLKLYKYIRENGGWDNFEFTIIDEKLVSSMKERLELEQEHMDIWSPSLNDQKAIVMGDYEEYLTSYKKQWYLKNREKELKKAKEAYAKNPEKKKKVAKEWREKNKERDRATRKAYRDSHKEEQKKLNKAWREKNKDKLKIQKAAKFQERKAAGIPVITCECGSTYQKGKKNRHEKTAKHKQWVDRNNTDIPDGKVRCPCGAIVGRSVIRRHERGNPHKKWLATQAE